jgi:hypothetical protein
MAIIDDYAAISTELRRIQAERSPREKPVDAARSELTGQHRMRQTIVGDLLYRRLVSPRRQIKLGEPGTIMLVN